MPFRVDPTIISTDVESVTLDKDRGAERALAFFSRVGPLPTLWRSMGDSRSDYLMADHLYAAGFEVAHVDVRPSDGILDRPYRVVVEGDAIHDAGRGGVPHALGGETGPAVRHLRKPKTSRLGVRLECVSGD